MFPQLGFTEILVLGFVAVLLFGSRLPEVGRSLGRGIIEFKKGLQGITDEAFSDEPAHRVSAPSRSTTTTTGNYDAMKQTTTSIETNVPKFVPPSQPPQPVTAVPTDRGAAEESAQD